MGQCGVLVLAVFRKKKRATEKRRERQNRQKENYQNKTSKVSNDPEPTDNMHACKDGVRRLLENLER